MHNTASIRGKLKKKGLSMFTLLIGNKNYSSWSMRPWLALKLADAPFEEEIVPLFTDE